MPSHSYATQLRQRCRRRALVTHNSNKPMQSVHVDPGNQGGGGGDANCEAGLELHNPAQSMKPVGGEKQPGGGASAQNFQAASQTGGGDDGGGGNLEEHLGRLAQNNPFACVAVAVLHILLYALITVMCAFHDVVCKMSTVLGFAAPFVVFVLVFLFCKFKTCCAHLTAA